MPERTTDAAASEPQDPTPGSAPPTSVPETGPPVPTAAETDPEQPSAGRSAPAASSSTEGAAEGASAGSATPASQMPEYKGEPLDAERGPGLGCFWIQVALLTFFLIFTPLTVTWGWDPLISGALLIFTLILLLFSGQTVIFLLRLVAADRRARRTPLSPTARPTVGQMEDADGAAVRDDPARPDPGDAAAERAEDPREDGGRG